MLRPVVLLQVVRPLRFGARWEEVSPWDSGLFLSLPLTSWQLRSEQFPLPHGPCIIFCLATHPKHQGRCGWDLEVPQTRTHSEAELLWGVGTRAQWVQRLSVLAGSEAWPLAPPFALCFLAAMTAAFFCGRSFHYACSAFAPASCGLKHLKPWATITPFFKWWGSVSHQQGKQLKQGPRGHVWSLHDLEPKWTFLPSKLVISVTVMQSCLMPGQSFWVVFFSCLIGQEFV